jgi:hypothetical protein
MLRKLPEIADRAELATVYSQRISVSAIAIATAQATHFAQFGIFAHNSLPRACACAVCMGVICLRIASLLFEASLAPCAAARFHQVRPGIGVHRILRHTRALSVHDAKVDLRTSVTLLRGAAIPIHSLDIVFGHTVAIAVHEPEIEL